MSIITTRDLTRVYRTYEKEPGLRGSLRNLLSRRHVGRKGLDSVSLSIGEGEIVGLLGPNGAGKTTMLKMLTGLIHPTSGTASVMGFVPWERKADFQRQYAIVMGQKSQVWMDVPALETFLLCKEIYQIGERAFRSALSELVEVLGVGSCLKTQVRRLSLGERMKMELIAALLHRPRLLFLDEPTIGLDVVSQIKIREFLRYHNHEHGTTVLLTSHYTRDIQDLCKRVIILDRGKQVCDGTLAAIVDRTSDRRVLKLTLAAPASEEEMRALGELAVFTPMEVTFNVSRLELPKVIAEVLRTHEVVDLSASEPSAEDVIARIFANMGRGARE